MLCEQRIALRHTHICRGVFHLPKKRPLFFLKTRRMDLASSETMHARQRRGKRERLRSGGHIIQSWDPDIFLTFYKREQASMLKELKRSCERG